MELYYYKVRKVLLIVLFSNLILGLVKILYGINSNVLSITADGYDSLLDAVTNIVGIVAIYFSGKPSDEEHKYGHSKIETFASILISFTLFVVSYEIITSAVERFLNHVVPTISISTYLLLMGSLLFTLIVCRYEKRMGEKYNSDLLISDSEHIKSDALATGVIIVSLIFIQMGYVILDPVLSVIIALMIVRTGIVILKDNLNILLDVNIIENDEIINSVMNIYGVNNVHNIRTRGTKSNVHLDMHLIVNNDLTVSQADQISKSCKNTLYNKFPQIKEIIIQVEPNKGIYDKVHYKR